MGPSQVEWYRRLSPAERWILLKQQMDAGWDRIAALPPETRARWIDELNRRHAEGNERILQRFRELDGSPADPARS